MSIKLIPNAGLIAWRSYSSWSMILGFLCLTVPNLLFAMGIETNPYPIGWAATVFFVAGYLGRFVDQDRSGRFARLIFVGSFSFGVGMFGMSVGNGIYEDMTLPDVEPVVLDEQAILVPVMGDPIVKSDLHVIGNMPVSDREFLAHALHHTATWEGKRNAAYLDRIASPHVWTVCYGETRGVKQGDYYTDAQCLNMLKVGLIEYRKGVHRYFTKETLTKRLPATRDAAYTGFAWNVGQRGAGKSTATRRLNAGDIAGGCKAMTWWNKAGGRVVRGLVNRRASEYSLCMQGVA